MSKTKNNCPECGKEIEVEIRDKSNDFTIVEEDVLRKYNGSDDNVIVPYGISIMLFWVVR